MMFCNAILWLITSFLAVDKTMAQYDTGAASAKIYSTPVSSGPVTTYLNLTFFHDNVGTGGGAYAVKYYYAGCVNQILVSSPPVVPPAIAPIIGLTTVSLVATTNATGADGSESLTCGVADNEACAKKSLYQYKLRDLDAITNTDIKSGSGVTGDPYKVKFCVRHSLLDASSPRIERGYKEADITVQWTNSNDFTGAVVTSENGPDDEIINIGDVSVQSQRCSNVVSPPVIPTVYNQGEQIQICLSASVPGNASVVITEVNELRFWIDNNLQGTNGIYDVGEVTQIGVTSSPNALVGTTTLLPSGVIGAGTAICNLPFIGYFPSSSTESGQKGCVLTTFLGDGFFLPTNTAVQYAGSVTIQFSNNNRRVLQLKNGDMFTKPFGSEVVTISRDSEDSCNCGGFFFIICIILCFFRNLFG